MTDTATSPTRLLSLFAERAAAGDVEAMLALYEPEAVFAPEVGTVLRGTEQIRPALAEMAGLAPMLEYTAEPDVVLVDNVALVTAAWTMTAQLPDGTALREGGLSADVLRRQPDGSWLVMIDQPRGNVAD